MTSFRPIIVFIVNFIVGIAISQGYVETDNPDQLVNDIADSVGYLIIFITSMAAIVHALKHPHKKDAIKPVVNIDCKHDLVNENNSVNTSPLPSSIIKIEQIKSSDGGGTPIV